MMPREPKYIKEIRERNEAIRKEREELWQRIEQTNAPEEVMEIMTGKKDQYNSMSNDQYRQPGHSYLMNARHQLWDKFWNALEQTN
jgi:hypothetical protein